VKRINQIIKLAMQLTVVLIIFSNTLLPQTSETEPNSYNQAGIQTISTNDTFIGNVSSSDYLDAWNILHGSSGSLNLTVNSYGPDIESIEIYRSNSIYFGSGASGGGYWYSGDPPLITITLEASGYYSVIVYYPFFSLAKKESESNSTLSSTGDYSFTLSGAALPVELTSFSAMQFKNSIKLMWETATEVNNYGFEIQKSGVRSKELGWEKIGFVNGQGNSNSPKNYDYMDNSNLTTGEYSYRLKQIDNDGAFEYSDEVNVTIGVPSGFTLEQNYPNPFNPTTNIKFSLPVSGLVNIKVYNAIGEQVAELMNRQMEAGSYSIPFNATGLPNGVYLYKIDVNNFTSVKKMILIK
jgi:Secretion system C-terminal sorting domain